jgi:hypothetical protein
LQADVETARLTGRFDAIVGRFVLREVGDTVRVLRKVSRLLVSGGILAFQEKVLAIPVASFPQLFVLEQVRSWMDEARRHAGVEIAMGAEVPRLYQAAGLSPPNVRLDAPVGFGPDWKGYSYLVETLRGMLPLMALYGIATQEQIGIDQLEARMRAEAIDRGAVVVLTPSIGAWTRCRRTATLRQPL